MRNVYSRKLLNFKTTLGVNFWLGVTPMPHTLQLHGVEVVSVKAIVISMANNQGRTPLQLA